MTLRKSRHNHRKGEKSSGRAELQIFSYGEKVKVDVSVESKRGVPGKVGKNTDMASTFAWGGHGRKKHEGELLPTEKKKDPSMYKSEMISGGPASKMLK